jgi:hypothetical protein
MIASAVSRRSACIAIWAFELAMSRWGELPANAAIRLTPSIAAAALARATPKPKLASPS